MSDAMSNLPEAIYFLPFVLVYRLAVAGIKVTATQEFGLRCAPLARSSGVRCVLVK